MKTAQILKLNRHNSRKEIEFELKYLRSLSVRQRFEMMFKKTKEIINLFVKGVSFEEVWKNKVKAKFGDTAVYFASLNDLIKMKRAAGRPKDLDDLKYLSRLT